jgi:hypothetical protein
LIKSAEFVVGTPAASVGVFRDVVADDVVTREPDLGFR